MLDVPADQLCLLFQGQGAFLQNGLTFRFARRFDIQVEVQRLFPDNFAGFLTQLLADGVRQFVGRQRGNLVAVAVHNADHITGVVITRGGFNRRRFDFHPGKIGIGHAHRYAIAVKNNVG
ncbi:Uncharacterised protein [Klebsiella pneumoniae]|nr:Uncharacterised protein [Klebsiella pneumoniae]SVM31606.1 Uncharacterised protein [Klebsiella pneumoniae]SVM48868.1 Uncharacterised protein [Klebsiella pneumoniae]